MIFDHFYPTPTFKIHFKAVNTLFLTPRQSVNVAAGADLAFHWRAAEGGGGLKQRNI